MPKSSIAAPPTRVQTFSPASLLARVDEGKSSKDYRVGQTVFAQGSAANAVFYLRSGTVTLTVASPRGKKVAIGTLGRGTFFGESCLTGQRLRMSTASAVRPSTIVRVAKPTMVALLHREPAFAQLFIAYLLSRHVRIEEELIDQLFNSSEKRLARVLLLLAHFGKTAKSEAVIPKLTEGALAALIGITRARIGGFMKRFRKMGFVDYDANGLVVHSGLLNVVLHD